MALFIVYGLVWFFLWMPPLGHVPIWEDPGRNLQQFIFPAIALGVAETAFLARVTRSAMLDVMAADYIRTARAKGMKEALVVLRHALKNFAIPIVTVIGLQFGGLLGGAVVVETVFAWPGMGRLVIQAINTRDYPVVQAVVFLMAVGFVVINTLIDLLYGVLDPRIRYG